MKEFIKSLIYRNKLIYSIIRRSANLFLIRPYIKWRNIPIISITGSNGKTTVTRLLNKIYLSAGYRVGMACTDGVYSDGIEIMHGDYTGGLGVWHATRGRDINILVAETGRGGIVKYGLGFSKCQVSVVTNIYEDHLGLDGIHTLEQLSEVKSTIVQHTESNGTAVLNGDDSLVRKMVSKSNSSVVYFTVENKFNEFSNCYYFHNKRIYKKSGSLTDTVIDVRKIPITLKGQLTYNVANVMAVLAAVEGMQPRLPVSLETVHSVLKKFGKNPNDNPTRLNFLRFKGRHVLLCRCKNPESVRRDVRVIQGIKNKYNFDHVIGMLTAVGDRSNEHFQKISRTAAPIFRYFFVRPPSKKYLRHRTGEEIVRLLSIAIDKDRILGNSNLPLELIFEKTEETLSGNILYVFLSALHEADLDIPNLISNSDNIPIDI